MTVFQVFLVLFVLHSDGRPSEPQAYPQPSIEACITTAQEKLNETPALIAKRTGDIYVAACRVEPAEGDPA